MARPDTKSKPRPGEIWLSRPPHVLFAHIVDLDDRRDPPVISYLLHDEEGFVERISEATLDRGWWHSFQPMERRYG